MVYPDFYQKICNGLYGYLFPDGARAARPMDWDHSFGSNQWWVDAFKVDPSQMLEEMQGLWEYGTPQPVTKTQLENANIGTLPSICVYIAIHEVHGTHAFFPFHGAKHGPKDQDTGEKKLYTGFKFWYTDLDDSVKARIVQHDYCNSPKAVELFRVKSSAKVQEDFENTSKFDPRFFLVCSLDCACSLMKCHVLLSVSDLTRLPFQILNNFKCNAICMA